MEKKKQTMEGWMFYAIVSALFATLTAVLIKLGVQTVDSDVATFYRTIVIFFSALAIIYIKGKRLSLEGISTKELVFLGLSGVATGLSWFAYFRAMKLGPISKVSLVDKSSVVLTVLVGLLLFKDAISFKGGVGMVLVLAGIYLMTIK
jgi:transporter family protein